LPPNSRPISTQTKCVISLCCIAGFTPGQWRREGSEGERKGGIWSGENKIWNYELRPLLCGELAFALQNGFGGNLHCVIDYNDFIGMAANRLD